MRCVGGSVRAARRLEAGGAGSLRWCEPRLALRLSLVGAAALATANCSAPPQVASHRSSIDPRYGVAASPRVVGENDPVPKGGGRDLVGRPYVIAGRTYVPRENPAGYVREGLASWYGTAFHGRLTANNEIFDRHSIAAAHPTLPLPSYARVTNLANGHSMIVRVNDRGPYHAGRLMDVSQRVAEALEFRHAGTARVRVEYVGKASLRGSDDTKLMATLRSDGRPAPFPGHAATMVADAGESFVPRPQTAGPALGLRPTATEAPERTLVAEAATGLPPRLAALPPARPGASPSSASVRVAAAPLPPERPFDLDTIPSAGSPVRVSVGRTAHAASGRATVAGLF